MEIRVLNRNKLNAWTNIKLVNDDDQSQLIRAESQRSLFQSTFDESFGDFHASMNVDLQISADIINCV